MFNLTWTTRKYCRWITGRLSRSYRGESLRGLSFRGFWWVMWKEGNAVPLPCERWGRPREIVTIQPPLTCSYGNFTWFNLITWHAGGFCVTKIQRLLLATEIWCLYISGESLSRFSVDEHMAEAPLIGSCRIWLEERCRAVMWYKRR